MKGEMTAYYTGDDELVVQNYLLYHLAVEINSQRVLIGTIDEVFFIGASQFVAATGQGGDPALVEDDNSSASSIIPLVMSVPIAVVAFLALFAIVVGKRRRSREIVIVETQDDGEDYVSANSSIDPLYEQKESISPVATSPDLEFGQLQNYYGESVPDRQTETVEPRSDSPNLLLDLEADHHPTTMNAAIEQQLSYPPMVAPMMMVDVLPPRPSAKTAAAKQPVSKTLKRRRRKKKNKKKPPITRVNSRENVKVMETVDEAADERGSDEDDCYGSGSEYSWSTDEADSRPNSREASPVRTGRHRSPSPGPSRHRSPSPGPSPIRPGRNHTPPRGRPKQADITPVPFVTGNFAQGFMTPENVWTDSGNAQVPNNIPSPIEEEPKIKPLPPPWV
jgi:hypothetical protein